MVTSTIADVENHDAHTSQVPDRLTGYLVFLLFFVSICGFIDTFATTFRYSMIPFARKDFDVSFATMVKGFTWVYLGSCLAIVPRFLADIVGRRAMLLATMAGLYTLQWCLSFSRTLDEYIALLALLALFYRSDIWMLVVSEEAPPKHRAFCNAVSVALSACGVVTLGELMRRMGPEPDAWRYVARFPIWGLLVAVPFIFFFRETRHFDHWKSLETRRGVRWSVLVTPFRRTLLKRLLLLTLLKMFFVGGAMVFMAMLGYEYLKVDNAFSSHVVGRIVQFDVLAVVAAWLLVGFLSDRLGRHVCVYAFGAIYVVALLHLALLPKGSMGVIIAFVTQIFAGTAVFAMLRVATMEVFPNDCRATGSAWTDVISIAFAAVTARVLGALSGSETRQGFPLSTCIIIVAIGVALVLPLFAFIRETRGQKLEEVV